MFIKMFFTFYNYVITTSIYTHGYKDRHPYMSTRFITSIKYAWELFVKKKNNE